MVAAAFGAPRPRARHGSGLTDQHAGARPRHELGERATAAARGNDVRAEVTDRLELAVASGTARETAEAATGDILEKDPLDRIEGAEAKDLVDRGLDQGLTHGDRTLEALPPGHDAGSQRRRCG